MDKYLYVAMTGASQNALAQKAHANNLANISTNGFQKDLEQARSMPVFGDSFPARAFALSERPATDFSPGSLVETGRDLDVAVSGNGWIAVQNPDGNESYVRTGSLNVDALGVLRAGGTLTQELPAPPIAEEENKDLKRERNYPEQPPTIPHSIRGYHIDKNSNKCLSCHSRANSALTQAPMISITHYMDRDGQALAAVSPRRYFCNQCHVPQQDVKPLINNSFKNIDQVLQDEINRKQKP